MAAGQSQRAWQLLAPLVELHSLDLDLQMTAGLTARGCGDLPSAIACFRRAKEAAPSRADVANILANTLDSNGQVDDALATFDEILRSNPDFVDAHINRAITAQKKDLGLALKLVEQSLLRHPANARLWSIKGAILKESGDQEGAVDAFDRSLAIEPQRALTWFHRGVTHRAMECHAQALSDYEQAARFGATGPQFDAARAAVLLELGQVDAAEGLYEAAHRSGDLESGVALTRLRREYRDEIDPFAHFEAIIAERRTDEGAWLQLLSNLLEYSEFERLRVAGERARQILPDSASIRTLAAIGEARAGNRAEGIEEIEQLAKLDPANTILRLSLAEICLLDADPERCLVHATEVTRRVPLEQGGWAFLSTAWRLMDDEREFWLCDYDRLVMVSELVNEEVAETSQAYASYLAEVLEALHVTRHAPGNQSLREGTQTSGALFNRPDPRLKAMRDAVLRAVDRAVAALPDDPAHPFLSRKSDLLRFQGSWSVRLAGARGGHHVSHYHGQGWISSAYYARLPGQMKQEGAGNEGCIHFGAPPEHLGLALPPRRIVRPKEGLMALFPSYMWHGTMPFAGDDVRLTAAFDIVPS